MTGEDDIRWEDRGALDWKIWYVLDEQNRAVLSTFEIACQLYASPRRQVAFDEIGDAQVSTVFLVMDHRILGDRPLLFETKIFGGAHDGGGGRCSTWDEAVVQHEEACALVRRGGLKVVKGGK